MTGSGHGLRATNFRLESIRDSISAAPVFQPAGRLEGKFIGFLVRSQCLGLASDVILAIVVRHLDTGLHLGRQPPQVVVHVVVLQIGDAHRAGQFADRNATGVVGLEKGVARSLKQNDLGSDMLKRPEQGIVRANVAMILVLLQDAAAI
jgi:hypothetical protein